jgi:type VI protein secretion system component Hcp
MTRNQKPVGNMFSRFFQGWAVLLLIVGAHVFMTLSASAAIDAYLRIPDMDGASKDPAHLNWITVSSVVAQDLNSDAQADRESSAPSVSEVVVSKSASGAGAGKTTIGSATSGAGSGKAAAAPRDTASGLATGRRMHKPFTITKEIDKASPLLAQACASGKHLPEVDVDLGSGGHYKLMDVMISSDTKSSGGDRPMESISFTYQKIEMTR